MLHFLSTFLGTATTPHYDAEELQKITIVRLLMVFQTHCYLFNALHCRPLALLRTKFRSSIPLMTSLKDASQ
jgi:hypothetical protein